MCCDPSPGSHAIKNCGQDWPCPCKHNFEARSRNHYCRGKAKLVTYSQCVSVVLVLQCSMSMLCVVVICGLTWGNKVYPHYLINGMIFGGGEKILNMKHVVLVPQ